MTAGHHRKVGQSKEKCNHSCFPVDKGIFPHASVTEENEVLSLRKETQKLFVDTSKISNAK